MWKKSAPNHPGKPLHLRATREKSAPNHPGKPLHPPPLTDNAHIWGLPFVELSCPLLDDSIHLRPSAQRGNFSYTESLCGRMIKGSKKGFKLKSKYEVTEKVT